MTFICLLTCLLLHVYNKKKLSLIFLLFTSLCCFSFAAQLDPFLNLWDERFHALVGKNLMHNFFKPMLYADPLIDVESKNWVSQHIWLHKQPLFLWQIALSFKVFGISIFSLRIPDIILGTFMVYTNYRSGKLLGNERVAILTGILTLSTTYFLSLITGRVSTDHNDFTFLAYVSFSIWGLVEYTFSKKKKWLFVIGVFGGCAILTKWLVGLLVYLLWGILKLCLKEYSIKKNKDLLISLVVSIIIALPWQIFILIQYPELAKEEYAFNALHLTEVVEGHKGPYWYYFENFNLIYGAFASFLIIPGLLLIYKKSLNKNLIKALFGAIIFVYLFFTVLPTKMPSFTIIVSMIILIALATLVNEVLQKIKFKKLRNVVFIISTLVIVLLRLDLEELQLQHTLSSDANYYSKTLIHNKKVFESLDLPENAVLFNTKNYAIDAMFYTGRTAYSFVPSKKQCQILKQKKKVIAIIDAASLDLPNYLEQDKSLIKLSEKIYD
jgi:hypothetical protein